jgi:hypothetical protein
VKADPTKVLSIPMNELLFVDPNVRYKLFLDLVSEYKKRFPDMKMIKAYLNYEVDLRLDYMLVFTAVQENLRLILFEFPLAYTDRSIPGYRYCKRENKMDDFFKEAIGQMTKMAEGKFREFITSYLKLSLDKTKETYWGSVQNIKKVAGAIVDVSIR